MTPDFFFFNSAISHWLVLSFHHAFDSTFPGFFVGLSWCSIIT